MDKKILRTFVLIGLAGGEPFDFSLKGETKKQEEDRLFLQRKWLEKHGYLIAYGHRPTGEAIGWVADFVRATGGDPNLPTPQGLQEVIDQMPPTAARGGRVGLVNSLVLMKEFLREIGEEFPPDLTLQDIEECALFYREHGWD